MNDTIQPPSRDRLGGPFLIGDAADASLSYGDAYKAET